MTAARGGYIEILQILIQAEVDLNIQNEAGRTAILLAVMEGDVEAVRILIEAGADINIMTPEGVTPLCATSEPEIIQLLEAAAGFYDIHENTPV